MNGARTFAMLAVVVLASGIGIGGVAFALFGNRPSEAPSAATTAPAATDSPPRTATQTVTETTMAARPPCTDAPRGSVSNVDFQGIGLVLTVSFSTTCDEGDTLTGPSVVLSAAQGSRDFASGAFDLDSNPIAIPANGTVERKLVYPAGMFWRTPELIQQGPMDVEVRGAGPGGSAGYAGGGSSTTLTAYRAASPTHGTADSTAQDALQELMNEDRNFVNSTLQNWWVPQISSKRVGTRDDGIVYGNDDILRNHFQLRERYPSVKLVWSNDWTTFDGTGYWVSVVGQPYYAAPEANGWCDQNGIGINDCFAKMISNRYGVEGTTVVRH